MSWRGPRGALHVPRISHGACCTWRIRARLASGAAVRGCSVVALFELRVWARGRVAAMLISMHIQVVWRHMCVGSHVAGARPLSPTHRRRLVRPRRRGWPSPLGVVPRCASAGAPHHSALPGCGLFGAMQCLSRTPACVGALLRARAVVSHRRVRGGRVLPAGVGCCGCVWGIACVRACAVCCVPAYHCVLRATHCVQGGIPRRCQPTCCRRMKC